MPAFETSDGICITGSNAIAYYLANEQLRGKTPIDQSQIIQWISYAENDILPPACAWVFPILGIMPYNKQVSLRIIVTLTICTYFSRTVLTLSDCSYII